jgi:hypothetical protein
MPKAQNSNTFSLRILWQVFFLLGFLLGLFGAGLGNLDVNGYFTGLLNLTSGFFFIILGILIIAVYLMSQEKRKQNLKNKK